MSPTSIRHARHQLQLTQCALASRLGVTRVTVVRWEAGTVPIRPTAALLLQALLAQRQETTS